MSDAETLIELRQVSKRFGAADRAEGDAACDRPYRNVVVAVEAACADGADGLDGFSLQLSQTAALFAALDNAAVRGDLSGFDILLFADESVQRILHGTNRGQGVHSGADPAHPADKGPGIARVATFQDLFQQADHGPRRIGIGDLAVLNFCFHPQMSLDTGDGIYDQSF